MCGCVTTLETTVWLWNCMGIACPIEALQVCMHEYLLWETQSVSLFQVFPCLIPGGTVSWILDRNCQHRGTYKRSLVIVWTIPRLISRWFSDLLGVVDILVFLIDMFPHRMGGRVFYFGFMVSLVSSVFMVSFGVSCLDMNNWFLLQLVSRTFTGTKNLSFS